MLDEKVDVGDTDEQETEIDLEAPAQEKSQEEEIHVEQVAEDNSQPANASQESSQQSDVQTSEQKKELDDYSDGVQKRIAKLTRKMREAERQKEEAIKYAQQMREQAEKTKNQFDQLGTNYTKELEQKVSTGIEAAKAKLKAAAEAGDIDAQVEAQKAVAQMAMEEARLNQLKVEQEARLKKTPQSQSTENIAQAAQGMPTSVDIAQAGRQLDPKAEAWAEKNPWFGTDNAMTYTAFDLHKKLTEEEGFDAQSDEYYAEIDKRMRLDFPHKFGTNDSTVTTKPTQTVASAKRSVNSSRKTVRLTPSQVTIAKKLGVPLEEYAKQLNITKEI